jgi:hypothetical protein
MVMGMLAGIGHVFDSEGRKSDVRPPPWAIEEAAAVTMVNAQGRGGRQLDNQEANK